MFDNVEVEDCGYTITVLKQESAELRLECASLEHVHLRCFGLEHSSS